MDEKEKKALLVLKEELRIGWSAEALENYLLEITRRIVVLEEAVRDLRNLADRLLMVV